MMNSDEIRKDAISILASVRNWIDRIDNLPKEDHNRKISELRRLRHDLHEMIETFKIKTKSEII